MGAGMRGEMLEIAQFLALVWVFLMGGCLWLLIRIIIKDIKEGVKRGREP